MGEPSITLRRIVEARVPQTSKRFALAFVLMFLTVILVRQIWLFSVIERDEGGIALVSLQWLNGLLPYVNSINNAGPLAYVMYSVSTFLFGTDFIPIRMINNVLFFLSIIPFYLLTRDWFNRNVALISSIFYGIFMSAPIYEGQLALTSSVSAPIVVFSVFFCSCYYMRNSWKALFASAFLLSIATLTKLLVAPLLLLLLGAVVLKHYKLEKNQRTKGLAKDSLVVMVGFSILPMVFVLYFAWMGALGNLASVFIGLTIGSHLSVPDVPLGISLYVVTQGLPLWIFGVVGLVDSFLKRSKFNLLLIGWTILAIVFAAFPPHFGHRYIYLIAPASILAGVGVGATLKDFKFGLKRRLDRRLAVFLLMIAVLLFSSVIAVMFQTEQYPQYQINSKYLNFEWLYADPVSYSCQTELSEFLRTNCPPGSAILVHGWASEIYYLANKLPPSKYAWSKPDPIQNPIPEDEYNRLVAEVKSQEFEFIVFFDTSLKALEYRRDDPIVNQTLNIYTYFGNIDNALIFRR